MNPSLRLRCILIGGQSILIACGELLRSAGHSIGAVISADREVAAWCAQHAIPHHFPDSALDAALAARPFDYLFSIANYEILPDQLLALPEKGAINFHDGPLPHYAGLNVTTWALLHGETTHAVTWHRVTNEVDKGAILKQRSLSIHPGDTALTLNARCYEVAIQCFGELMEELARGDAVAVEQERSGFRFFSRCKRPAPACLLNWKKPAAELDAMFRALSFGPYRNPIGVPKVAIGGGAYGVAAFAPAGEEAAQPGEIMEISEAGIRVGTASGCVRIGMFHTLAGVDVAAVDLMEENGLRVGDRLPVLDSPELEALGDLDKDACRHEPFWYPRLAAFEPLDIPFKKPGASTARGTAQSRQEIAEALRPKEDRHASADALLTAWLIYLSRISGKPSFDVAYTTAELRLAVAGHEAYFGGRIPLHAEIDGDSSFDVCRRTAQQELAAVGERFTFARDLLLRYPELRRSVAAIGAAMSEAGVERVAALEGYQTDGSCNLSLVIPDGGAEILWTFNPARYDESTIARMQEQFEALLTDLSQTEKPVNDLSIVASRERTVMANWNSTAAIYDAQTIQQAFEDQVRRTPDACALLFRDEALSFRQLDERAEALARRLQAKGVEPDQMVGLLVGRSTHMVVAMLGILKAGGAYVPLDPAYPRERLLYMIEDSRIGIVVTEERFEEWLDATEAESLRVESVSPVESGPRANGRTSGSDHLAYVIYTSGSTGKPKGVMITHRNVANFFAGMDQRIEHRSPGTWLAVTSISFDISVLEILWSLTRGLTVALYAGDDRKPALPRSNRPIDFSLYYFPSDEGEETEEKFRLLMDGARFADANGFEAVWTPERHFHAFGGLFPNPSVSSAAVAAVTRNVKIRAGSCVLPLHHPVRVAEEWAFVDNISHGRVGIGFAAGWQPNDFVLAPHNYANRHEVMYKGIETVRALWRGETITLPGADGGPVEIAIKPRPVQKDLPFWITVAGNPETYRKAGERGANILTHLLGQSLEEVGEKIAIYREARQQHGYEGDGHVTLMLHTVVGPDEEDVRHKAHDALKSYLATAAGLIKHYASSFPTFKTQISAGRNVDEIFASLPPGDVDALLEHAVARYYDTSGLFGTYERCEAMIERCKAIGVDEIACLIDFGMAPKVAEEHLPYLAELRARVVRRDGKDEADYSIPALIERHHVTHFQCTPSMATMLVADRRGRDALRHVANMMVGGEAFPPGLAAELRALLPGDLINMYGPTETTVWSTTFRIESVDGAIPIGRPIANTALHILDSARQSVPVGVPGELYIAGDGVVRGYWNRPELTAERFLPDPFAGKPGARMYRTGDLVRYSADGNVEFLGRMDNQVKIRGYRIELGEIESLLRSHEAVREAVVAVREEKGNKRLAAYLVPHAGRQVDREELRRFLSKSLAEFMIPASFTLLPALPLTPNGKVDRRALPDPDENGGSAAGFVAPATETERQIAESWQFLLKKGRVGVNDDFFHMGGDSLGAVQLVAVLSDTFGVELPLEAIFREPTIVRLARTIDNLLKGKQAGAA